jgi:nucleotide-binding universal stress UspA family protein
MIREIFVPLLNAGGDSAALDAAAVLAKQQQARVSVLVTLEHPLPIVTEFGYVPVEVGQRQLEAARAQAEALAASARERLDKAEVAGEVRITDVMLLWSEETAALQARHADITILGRPEPAQAKPRFNLTFKSLLLQSGRPVLVVPQGARLKASPQRVVIAWQPSREATRALHDALPLLPPGTTINVLMIGPEIAEGQHGQEPGADIARHLLRHGHEVTVVAKPRIDGSDGISLLRHVAETGAELLVMGGYGHSRLRELVLGGATRAVLEGAATPVLFSH